MGSATYAPMARTQVARMKRDLDDLVLRCEELDQGDEIRADAFRYAYVRLTGFLEQTLLWSGQAICHRHGVAQGRAFSLSWLERWTKNPTVGETHAFVHRFDPTWANELELWFAEDERGTRINSLVGMRNEIAHGRSSGASARTFYEYYDVVSELADWLVEHFDPLPVAASAT